MKTVSNDGCKTWQEPEYFYDYGVLPVSRMFEDGTVLVAFGSDRTKHSDYCLQ